MTRIAVPALVLMMAVPVLAHHSYGDIVREQTVSLSGVVEQIDFVNPHVMMRLRADDGIAYTIEWGNVLQMARTGVAKDTVQKGDRLTVTGSPHRDPAKHLLTLLIEIKRPADGWRWTKGGTVNAGAPPRTF